MKRFLFVAALAMLSSSVMRLHAGPEPKPQSRALPPMEIPQEYLFMEGEYLKGDETEEAAAKIGRELAKKDFKEKKYRVLVFGLRRGNSPAETYLIEQYKVYTVPAAGCVVSPAIIGVCKGYNEVMKAELEKLHGKDIFAEAAKQAPKPTARYAEEPNPAVSVIGEGEKQRRLAWVDGMTLREAIREAGGFSEYAWKHSVRIRRDGRFLVVDAVAAGDSKGDFPLRDGDVIIVPRSAL